MELQLVNKETAVLAKELGFDWNCKNAYNSEGKRESSRDFTGEETFTKEDIQNAFDNEYIVYLAPEQELLAKWLRDVHKTHIEVLFNGSESFYYWIKELIPFGKEIDSTMEEECNWKTYEEAMEAGLKVALEDLGEKLQSPV